MEKLYKMVQGYRKRFPSGIDPFKMVTRLMEECGEVAAEVNKWEDSGKSARSGEPTKENMAEEVRQVLLSVMQIAVYYGIENELENEIDSTLKFLQENGYIE